jgi:hypothetical protein
MANMICPQCGQFQEKADICSSCGIVVAKFKAESAEQSSKNQKCISGMGKESVLPPEIKGWNWGAFFLSWIWGIGNSTYIALLMFVPFVNFVMPFVLGAKGNKWAWQNRTWRDVEHFKHTQRKWTIAGLLLVLIVLPLFIFSISNMLKGEAYKLSLTAIESNVEVNNLIGSPIEAGLFVVGNTEVSGPDGKASLQYSISGPKGDAVVYVSAIKQMGRWVLQEVVVHNVEQRKKIQVVAPIEEKDNDQPSNNTVIISPLTDGWQAYENKDYSQAIRLYSKHIQNKPEDKNGFYYRALAYEKTNDDEKALEDFLQTVRLENDYFDAYLHIDSLLAKKSRYEEIVQYWSVYIEQVNTNGRAYLERGGAYIHAGKKVLALKDAKKACELGEKYGCQLLERHSGE